MSETQLAKNAMSLTADEALNKALERINTDFLGGRITKLELTSWLIVHGAEHLTDGDIDEIRRVNFNQVNYLEALAKKFKSEGKEVLTKEEIAALNKMLGQPSGKKKSRQRTKKIPPISEREENHGLTAA